MPIANEQRSVGDFSPSDAAASAADAGKEGDQIKCSGDSSRSSDDAVGTITTMNDATTATVTNVLDAIGIEIYKYLHPYELLHFSLSNHHIHEEVSKGIIQACLRQLPPNFGSQGVDHCITFNNRHTFHKKEELLDHLLDKIRIAELKLVGSEDETVEESLIRARDVLSDQAGAKFFSYNDDYPPHLPRERTLEYTSAGYHYENDNKKLASSRSKYILSRMAMEGKQMTKHLPIVKTWMDYILAQRHVVAGTWFWSCRHRNLDFQGVEGKGVSILSPNAEGEEMEICWLRMTASRV